MTRVATMLVLAALGGCGAARAPVAQSSERGPEAEPGGPLTCTDYEHPIYFSFACRESSLHASDDAAADELAASLLAQRGLARVGLIGTQSRTGPEGTLPTELALRRAAAVSRVLAARGIDPALIHIDREESGYHHKSRTKSDPDPCTGEPSDRVRFSRRVRVTFTVCSAPEPSPAPSRRGDA